MYKILHIPTGRYLQTDCAAENNDGIFIFHPEAFRINPEFYSYEVRDVLYGSKKDALLAIIKLIKTCDTWIINRQNLTVFKEEFEIVQADI